MSHNFNPLPDIITNLNADFSPQLPINDYTLYTNSGAALGIIISLPGAVIGARLAFEVLTAQAFTIAAGSGESIIYDGLTVSGSFSSNRVGSYLELFAVASKKWIVRTLEGKWTIA